MRADEWPQFSAGEIWLLLIYAESAVDSIRAHILKAHKEEMEKGRRQPSGAAKSLIAIAIKSSKMLKELLDA